MALLPSPPPTKKNNALLVVALVVILVIAVLGTVLAVMFYDPTIFQTGSRGSNTNTLEHPEVTSATLACTGGCSLSAQFSDNTGQTMQISQYGPGSWTLDRPSNAYRWQVDWQVSLGDGSLRITLNTGHLLIQLQGPSSNQGSWSTGSGE